MKLSQKPGPFCSRALGITGGIFCAVDCFLMAFLASLGISFLWYNPLIFPLYESIIPRYSPTLGGAVIGMIWGFIVAFIALYVFATVYNYFWRSFYCGKKK